MTLELANLIIGVLALLLLANVAWTIHRLVAQLDGLAGRVRYLEIAMSAIKARLRISRAEDGSEASITGH